MSHSRNISPGVFWPVKAAAALTGLSLLGTLWLQGKPQDNRDVLTPWGIVAETSVDFGLVEPEKEARREISIENRGKGSLQILSADSSIRGLSVTVAPVVPPGEMKPITLILDTSDLSGTFEGEVLLRTNEEAVPEIRIAVRGEVTTSEAPFEIVPRRILAITAYRSEVNKASRSLTIANRSPSPLEILDIEGPQDRVRIELRPLEADGDYRLTVSLLPDAPAGRNEGTIRLRTNKGEASIVLLTFLRDEVFVAPESIDFRVIDRNEVKQNPGLGQYLPQVLHVYRKGSDPFTVEFASSLPFLALTREPVEGPGAVVDIPREGPTSIFDITVTPILEQLGPGPFEGVILIRTNDKRFPELSVPVKGSVR